MYPDRSLQCIVQVVLYSLQCCDSQTRTMVPSQLSLSLSLIASAHTAHGQTSDRFLLVLTIHATRNERERANGSGLLCLRNSAEIKVCS